ncbi:MAG: hypothetical protein HYY16_05525 [Planctomycetes bacterium]|nr:hypothetical protein [Planctomycetota bacterium]
MKEDSKDIAASRRDFLKKALRTTAYTVPLVTAMSMRSFAAAKPSKPPMDMGMGMG